MLLLTHFGTFYSLLPPEYFFIILVPSVKACCSSFNINVPLVGDFWSGQHCCFEIFWQLRCELTIPSWSLQRFRKFQSHTPIMDSFMKYACSCPPGSHRVQVSSSQNHIPMQSIFSGISAFFLYLQMWECQVLIYHGPQEPLSYLPLVLASTFRCPCSNLS